MCRRRTIAASTAALAAAAALAAGCGGAAGEPAGGVAGTQAQRSQEPRWASRAEVAWLARVAAWNVRFADAGRRVAAFESAPGFERVLAGRRDAVAEYERVLRPIARCPATFDEEVGAAPSERLRESERRFRDSCGHFARGVELMVDAVARHDQELADRARARIDEAGREAALASGTLPPGEKQELPEQDGTVDVSRVEPRFGAAASQVAGKDVEVRCWSVRDWKRLMVEERAYTRGKVDADVLGFASAGGARVNLSPGICSALANLAYREERPASRKGAFVLALGVATLAHESVHASGVADEPTAECHAVQRVESTARRLGANAAYARWLRDLYWAHYPNVPPPYRSDECRDGGELDLDPGSARFP